MILDGKVYVPRGRHAGMVLATCLPEAAPRRRPTAPVPREVPEVPAALVALGLETWAEVEALSARQRFARAQGASGGGHFWEGAATAIWLCARCGHEYRSPYSARGHADLHAHRDALVRLDWLEREVREPLGASRRIAREAGRDG